MKLSALLVTLLFVSCSSLDDNSQIQSLNGSWQLIEILMDPGDGSGQFQSTELQITLKIENNQTVLASGILCGFNESAEWHRGLLILPDSVITTSCQNGELRHRLQMDDSYLILSIMSCREPCRAKFTKIN